MDTGRPLAMKACECEVEVLCETTYPDVEVCAPLVCPSEMFSDESVREKLRGVGSAVGGFSVALPLPRALSAPLVYAVARARPAALLSCATGARRLPSGLRAKRGVARLMLYSGLWDVPRTQDFCGCGRLVSACEEEDGDMVVVAGLGQGDSVGF